MKKLLLLSALCLLVSGCVMHTGTVSTVSTYGRHGVYGTTVSTGSTFLPSGRDICYQFSDYGYEPLPLSAYPTGTVIIVNGPRHQPAFQRPVPHFVYRPHFRPYRFHHRPFHRR